VVRQAKLRRYVSSDHFSVDGTLLEAWASHKSFKPKDGPGPDTGASGRKAEANFHGEKRSNQTHRSTTDPEALLARKSASTPARLCYAGHFLMENRNALIVDIELTQADGYAEWATALEMLGRLPRRRRRRTVAADKGYDTAGFVADCRDLGVTPHGAPNTTNRRSAIDGRTTRHPGHRTSHGSGPGSRNPSAGPRPSPGAASSATEADNATEAGSCSRGPPTTSSGHRPRPPDRIDPAGNVSQRDSKQPTSTGHTTAETATAITRAGYTPKQPFFRTLLGGRLLAKLGGQFADLGFRVATVPTEGLQEGQLALLGPAGHRLGRHVEEVGDLGGPQVAAVGGGGLAAA
jgi:hypothetical protein